MDIHVVSQAHFSSPTIDHWLNRCIGSGCLQACEKHCPFFPRVHVGVDLFLCLRMHNWFLRTCLFQSFTCISQVKYLQPYDLFSQKCYKPPYLILAPVTLWPHVWRAAFHLVIQRSGFPPRAGNLPGGEGTETEQKITRVILRTRLRSGILHLH